MINNILEEEILYAFSFPYLHACANRQILQEFTDFIGVELKNEGTRVLM